MAGVGLAQISGEAERWEGFADRCKAMPVAGRSRACRPAVPVQGILVEWPSWTMNAKYEGAV